MIQKKEMELHSTLLHLCLYLMPIIIYYVIYFFYINTNCNVIISEWVNNVLTATVIILISVIFILFLKRMDIIFYFSLLILLTIFPKSQQIITGTSYSGIEYKGIFKISIFSFLILVSAVLLFFSKTKLYYSNIKLFKMCMYFVFFTIIISFVNEGFSSIGIIIENFVTPLCIMYIMLSMEIYKLMRSLEFLKVGIIINFILGVIEFIINKNIFESSLIELKISVFVPFNHIRSYGLLQHPLNYAFVGLISILVFIITRKKKDFVFVIIGTIMTIISMSRAGIFLAIILGVISLCLLPKSSKRGLLTIYFTIAYFFLIIIGGYVYFVRDNYDVYSKLSRFAGLLYLKTSFFKNFIVGHGLKQSLLVLNDELSQIARVNIIPENPTIILGSAYGYAFSFLLLFGLIFIINKIKDLYQKVSGILLLTYLQTFNSYGVKYVYFNLFIYIIWICVLINGNVNFKEKEKKK